MFKQALFIVLLITVLSRVSTKRVHRRLDHIYDPRGETCESLQDFYRADGCDDEFSFTVKPNGGLWCFRNQQHMSELGCNFCCEGIRGVRVMSSPCSRFDGKGLTNKYEVKTMAAGFKFSKENPEGCSKADGTGFTSDVKCPLHVRTNKRCMIK